MAPVVPSDTCRAPTLGFASTPSGLGFVYIKVLPVRRRHPSPATCVGPLFRVEFDPFRFGVCVHYGAAGAAEAPAPSDTCRAPP